MIPNEYFVRLYQMNSNIINVRSKLGSKQLSCTLKLSNSVIFPTETPITGKRFDTKMQKTGVVKRSPNFVYITSSNLATFSSETPITGKLFETVSQKTGGRKNPYFAVFVSRLTGTIFNLAVSYLFLLYKSILGIGLIR